MKNGLVKEGKMVKGKVKDTVFLILANNLLTFALTISHH